MQLERYSNGTKMVGKRRPDGSVHWTYHSAQTPPPPPPPIQAGSGRRRGIMLANAERERQAQAAAASVAVSDGAAEVASWSQTPTGAALPPAQPAPQPQAKPATACAKCGRDFPRGGLSLHAKHCRG